MGEPTARSQKQEPRPISCFVRWLIMIAFFPSDRKDRKSSTYRIRLELFGVKTTAFYDHKLEIVRMEKLIGLGSA